MEPILQGIITGLATQAITKVAGPAGRAANIIKPSAAPEWLSSSLTPSVTAAVRSMLADLANSDVSESDITKAAVTLRTSEAQQLQRSLVVSIITQKQPKMGNLTAELAAMFVYLGNCNSASAERLATSVGPILLNVATRSVETFQQASDRYYGVLRKLALQEEAAGSIERLVLAAKKTYRMPTSDELAEIHAFVETYGQEMIARTADIVPQHFDVQMRVPLNNLYVAPRFMAADEEVSRVAPMSETINTYASEITFTLAHAMRRMYRAIVLGAPGAGKTTLTQKIIADLCATPEVINTCVPFLITLRKYDQFRPDAPVSFVEYLVDYVSGQLHIPVTQRILQYLFTTGRAMVIFDGLDELLRLDRRKDLIDAIETFGRRYPNISILVTSRVIGYEQASLNRRIFSHMQLTNFDEPSVSTYVNNWFNLNTALDPLERVAVANNFLAESGSVGELRSNPLLLSLMCNIFRGAGYIPQNRADLYERCAVMLFEEWDHSRGIDSGGPLRADARFALQDIAYWTLTKPSLGAGIPERLLKERLTQFLSVNRYGSDTLADDAAAELLRLWRGRAWILTDLGSDKLHPIYQFTHRTFQEYFAATYLSRVSGSPKRLWRQIRAKAISGQWDVVAQIAIQAYNSASAGATDKIYNSIIQDVEKDKDDAIEALLFGCRHLNALAPGPGVVRRLVVVAVDLVCRTLPCFREQPPRHIYDNSRDLLMRGDEPDQDATQVAHVLADYGAVEDESELQDISDHRTLLDLSVKRINEPLAAVFSTSSLIYELSSMAFDDYCKTLIQGDDLQLASRGLLLVLARRQFILSAHFTITTTQDENALSSVVQKGDNAANELDSTWALSNLSRLSQYNFWLPIVAARYYGFSLRDLFNQSGLAALFNGESPFDVTIVGARPCLAVEMLSRYIGGTASLDDRNLLAEIGRYTREGFADEYMLRVDTDWLAGPKLGDIVIKRYFLNSSNIGENDGYYDRYYGSGDEHGIQEDDVREQDHDVVLGTAVLLCIISEAERWHLDDLSADKVAMLALGPVQFLVGIFLCRYSHLSLSEKHLARRIALPRRDLELLLDWSRGQLDFVN